MYACDADASCMVPDMCLYVRLCQTAVICISLIYIKTLFPKKIGTVCIILLNTETKGVQSNFGTEKLYSFFLNPHCESYFSNKKIKKLGYNNKQLKKMHDITKET